MLERGYSTGRKSQACGYVEDVFGSEAAIICVWATWWCGVCLGEVETCPGKGVVETQTRRALMTGSKAETSTSG